VLFELQINMLAEHPKRRMHEMYSETKQEVAKALAKWNMNAFSPTVRIYNNTMSCSCLGQWQSAILTEVFSKGIHEVKFRIDYCPEAGGIMIGLVTEHWDGYKQHKRFVGEDKMSWSLSSTGCTYHNGKRVRFGCAFQRDYIVTITANMTNGTMTAAIRGVTCGVSSLCHSNVEGRLRFAVSLYYPSCQVSLVTLNAST